MSHISKIHDFFSALRSWCFLAFTPTLLMRHFFSRWHHRTAINQQSLFSICLLSINMKVSPFSHSFALISLLSGSGGERDEADLNVGLFLCDLTCDGISGHVRSHRLHYVCFSEPGCNWECTYGPWLMRRVTRKTN